MIFIVFSLFNLVLSIRVGRRDKSPLNYTNIGNQNVDQFVKQHKKTVIFYSNSNKTLKPLSHSLQDFNGEIVFALHEQNPADNQYCISFPCASAYLNGEHIRSTISKFSPIDFQFWLSHTLNSQHFEVDHPEEFRQLLSLPGNSIFCVDCMQRVKGFPPSKVIYYITSNIAEKIGWTPKESLYFYRHADREMFAIKNYDPRYEESKLVDVGYSNIKSRKYLAGFMIEHIDDRSDKDKVDMAKLLANEYSDSVGVTVFADELSAHISSIGRFSQICGPLFVVFDTSNFKGPRWGEIDPGLINSHTRLSNMLGKIIRGDMKPGYISSTPTESANESSVMDIVASNFGEYVFSDTNSTVLLLYSTCSELDQSLLVGFDTMIQIFGNRTVQFFSMDQGRNDVPDGLPLYHAYPQIVGVKAKTKDFIQLNQFDASVIVKFMSEIGVETKQEDIQNFHYTLNYNIQQFQYQMAKEQEEEQRKMEQNTDL